MPAAPITRPSSLVSALPYRLDSPYDVSWIPARVRGCALADQQARNAGKCPNSGLLHQAEDPPQVTLHSRAGHRLCLPLSTDPSSSIVKAFSDLSDMSMSLFQMLALVGFAAAAVMEGVSAFMVDAGITARLRAAFLGTPGVAR